MKYRLFLMLVILTGGVSASFVSAGEKIDINKASLEDLVKIIHIGDARALELISLRPFASLDDLTKIKGIGEKRVEDIKNQGMAWVEVMGPSPVPSPTPRPQKELAAVGGSFDLIEIKPTSKSLYIFLIAIFTSLFGGAIILILKQYVGSFPRQNHKTPKGIS